jgi:anaerobic selenocysteine-containing dehydrogenase
MREGIQWKKTHCARMDHGGCALLVEVKENRIVKIKGDPDGYLNRGYVCAKGLVSPERLNHPDRLKSPLRRVGARGEGKWEKIPWSEALGEIVRNLSEIRAKHGARGVAFCQGMPKGLEHFVLIRLANLFGSPNVVAVQDVCHAPREVCGIYTCGFYPVADLHHPSEAFLLWGSNVTATNEEGTIGNLLMEQVKGGIPLVVVDPRKTELADRARVWLRLKPGSDNALALAFLNVVIGENLYDRAFVQEWTHGFEELAQQVKEYTPERMAEETWVAPELIRAGARIYAEARPAAVQWGNPLEQNAHTFHTVRAILCLMAVCGNLDVPGGNIQANEPPILPLGQFVKADRLPSKKKEMIHASFNAIPKLMTVPGGLFKKAVLEGVPYPVKAAYMQCTNPLLSWADSKETYKALMELDFLAVSEVFLTPTAALADVVLPAATYPEFNDIGHYGLGHGCILARPKVVDPPSECRPDMEILWELGRALTPEGSWPDHYEELLEEVLKPSGLGYGQFVQQGCLRGAEKFRKFLSSGFRTPTGKVELSLSEAEKLKLSPLPHYSGPPTKSDLDYPLILTTAKSPFYLHSSYRWVEGLRRREPSPFAELHPDTAAREGIGEGDPILIQTREGEISQIAHVTDRVLPGVVFAPMGGGFLNKRGLTIGKDPTSICSPPRRSWERNSGPPISRGSGVESAGRSKNLIRGVRRIPEV